MGFLKFINSIRNDTVLINLFIYFQRSIPPEALKEGIAVWNSLYDRAQSNSKPSRPLDETGQFILDALHKSDLKDSLEDEFSTAIAVENSYSFLIQDETYFDNLVCFLFL